MTKYFLCPLFFPFELPKVTFLEQQALNPNGPHLVSVLSASLLGSNSNVLDRYGYALLACTTLPAVCVVMILLIVTIVFKSQNNSRKPN
jgi:hypothetical protein